ncbi:MAG: DNA-binding response regulator [Balneolaceae bacterium]|nr:MAG: DNA-binding response regulator [Balneolaceae bacterium]
MESTLIKISIVEDNIYMREGWESILDTESDFCVIGSYGSCEEAFEDSSISRSDIVLMDIELPGMSGIEGVSYIQENHPGVNIIMASVFDDNQHVFDAICAGAIGYLLKKTGPDELCDAIRSAMEGGSPMTPEIARKVIRLMQPKQTGADKVKLSDRELEILKELSTGKSYQAIGSSIFLSEDGVRYHIRNIYKKLHVNSRSQAVAKGFKQNLI